MNRPLAEWQRREQERALKRAEAADAQIARRAAYQGAADRKREEAERLEEQRIEGEVAAEREAKRARKLQARAEVERRQPDRVPELASGAAGTLLGLDTELITTTLATLTAVQLAVAMPACRTFSALLERVASARAAELSVPLQRAPGGEPLTLALAFAEARANGQCAAFRISGQRSPTARGWHPACRRAAEALLGRLGPAPALPIRATLRADDMCVVVSERLAASARLHIGWATLHASHHGHPLSEAELEQHGAFAATAPPRARHARVVAVTRGPRQPVPVPSQPRLFADYDSDDSNEGERFQQPFEEDGWVVVALAAEPAAAPSARDGNVATEDADRTAGTAAVEAVVPPTDVQATTATAPEAGGAAAHTATTTMSAA
eukprot:5084763-Prymnesium_polylepis.1